MKTALLLIATLILSSTLCAATCLQASAEPSCHHQKNSPSICSHELILERSPAHFDAAALPPALLSPILSIIASEPPAAPPPAPADRSIEPNLRL